MRESFRNATTAEAQSIFFDEAPVPLLNKCPLWRDRYDKYFFVARFIEFSTNLFDLLTNDSEKKREIKNLERQEINVQLLFAKLPVLKNRRNQIVNQNV